MPWCSNEYSDLYILVLLDINYVKHAHSIKYSQCLMGVI